MKEIILASNSPRRKQILKKAGISFKVITKDVKEKHSKDYDENIVTYNSDVKASAAAADLIGQDYIVIGADTVVVLDSVCLVKPQSILEAIFMLKKLSNKTHFVITSHTFINTLNNKKITKTSTTKVTFKKLNFVEILSYIISKKPLDKAGSYGIQDFIDFESSKNPPKSSFISKIEGSYYNVVGFDIDLILETLDNF